MNATLDTPTPSSPVAAAAPIEATAPVSTGVGGPIEWRVWPVVDHVRSLWSAPAGAGLLSVIVGVQLGSWLCAALTIASLAVAMAPILVPTRYTITASGIVRQRLGRRLSVPWSQVRGTRRRGTELLLLVRPLGGRLNRMPSRLVRLPLPADDSLEASALLRRLERPADAS